MNLDLTQILKSFMIILLAELGDKNIDMNYYTFS